MDDWRDAGGGNERSSLSITDWILDRRWHSVLNGWAGCLSCLSGSGSADWITGGRWADGRGNGRCAPAWILDRHWMFGLDHWTGCLVCLGGSGSTD